MLGGTGAAAAILAGLIFAGRFPDCFIEGQGLTSFKVAAEWAIMAAFAATALRLRATRDQFAPPLYRLIFAAALLSLVVEACFTLYRDVYGVLNMAGHLVAVLAAYLIYAGLIRYGLSHPQEVLYGRLNELNARLADAALKDNERAAMALLGAGAVTSEGARMLAPSVPVSDFTAPYGYARMLPVPLWG